MWMGNNKDHKIDNIVPEEALINNFEDLLKFHINTFITIPTIRLMPIISALKLIFIYSDD